MRNNSSVMPIKRRTVAAAKPLYESVVLDSTTSLDLLPYRPGVVSGVIWKPVRMHHDSRGWLCEVYRQDEVSADMQPAMAYVSETLPGATRGPHEHLQQT